MSEYKWFDNYDEVVQLGQYLIDNDLIESDNPVGSLQYFYEKPWKWAEEYKSMLAEQIKKEVSA